MPAFSQSSAAKLVGLHPILRAVLDLAITHSDFTVIEGVRSKEQCFINFGKGRTAAQCLAGNCPASYAQPHLAKVTWLGHALSCNHLAKADGHGHAVDIAPYPVDWNDFGRFAALSKVMFAAFDQLKAQGKVPSSVKMRWGADWNCNGKPREKGETDAPHFEIIL